MRVLLAIVVLASLGISCSNNRSVRQDNPTAPTGPSTNQSALLTGTWVGVAVDSSGGVMGTGQGQASITMQLTQNGNQVTGTVIANGFTTPAGQSGPTVAGTVSGQLFSFTITAPAGTIPPPVGSVPMGGVSTCSATSTGTMTLTGTGAAGSTLSGTYTGIGSCSGAFSNGQITLTKQ